MATKNIPQDCSMDEMVTKNDFQSLLSLLMEQQAVNKANQQEIIEQLKILNTYMALITDHKIGESQC